jgi:cytochrome b561
MKTQRYTYPAMLFHWGQAVLIAWLLWLGYTMVDLPKGAERSAAYSLHKSLGLLVLFLTMLRLLWRWRHVPPALTVHGWERKMAHGTHLLLYAFLIFAPLAGYLLSSFTQFPLKFFGLEVMKVGWPDEALNGFFKQAHVILVWSGALLIALHVAGAIKHALQGEGVLYRMLPGRRR